MVPDEIPRGIIAELSACELFPPTEIRVHFREAHLGDGWLGCVGCFVEVLPEDFDLFWVVLVSAFVLMRCDGDGRILGITSRYLYTSSM